MSTLSHLNDLIAQAYATLSELDSFDIDDADPASVDDFASLNDEHSEDVKTLVLFVAANSAEILAALK
jgi:hypothetical protein